MTVPVFEKAHFFTAQWEGGYVNHVNDPGGATNFGVSLRWLRQEKIDVNEDGVIDIKDIKNLTPALAASLFKSKFWDALDLSSLPKYTAIVTYDGAINTGGKQSVKFLQQAVNFFLCGRLAVDGLLGQKTIAAVKMVDDYSLAVKQIEFREKFHRALATNSPYSDGRDYRPFLKGWLNRCSALHTYLGTI